MKWPDAQRYCREHYTDLASVRNTTENDEIRKLVNNKPIMRREKIVDQFAWIGLHRESWKWSDGQRMRMTSFSSWNQSQQDTNKDFCVTTTNCEWNARLCNNTYAFACRGKL